MRYDILNYKSQVASGSNHSSSFVYDAQTQETTEVSSNDADGQSAHVEMSNLVTVDGARGFEKYIRSPCDGCCRLPPERPDFFSQVHELSCFVIKLHPTGQAPESYVNSTGTDLRTIRLNHKRAYAASKPSSCTRGLRTNKTVRTASTWQLWP